MNPDTNRFEKLTEEQDKELETKLAEMQARDMTVVARAGEGLIRPDGTPVPKHWSVFTVGEEVVIKDYTFECKYVGETSILFEPVGPVVVGEGP